MCVSNSERTAMGKETEEGSYRYRKEWGVGGG